MLPTAALLAYLAVTRPTLVRYARFCKGDADLPSRYLHGMDAGTHSGNAFDAPLAAISMGKVKVNLTPKP